MLGVATTYLNPFILNTIENTLAMEPKGETNYAKEIAPIIESSAAH